MLDAPQCLQRQRWVPAEVLPFLTSGFAHTRQVVVLGRVGTSKGAGVRRSRFYGALVRNEAGAVHTLLPITLVDFTDEVGDRCAQGVTEYEKFGQLPINVPIELADKL